MRNLIIGFALLVASFGASAFEAINIVSITSLQQTYSVKIVTANWYRLAVEQFPITVGCQEVALTTICYQEAQLKLDSIQKRIGAGWLSVPGTVWLNPGTYSFKVRAHAVMAPQAGVVPLAGYKFTVLEQL